MEFNKSDAARIRKGLVIENEAYELYAKHTDGTPIVTISQERFSNLKNGIIERDKTIDGLLADLQKISNSIPAHNCHGICVGCQVKKISDEAIARAGR